MDGFAGTQLDEYFFVTYLEVVVRVPLKDLAADLGC
jgi:hypothetical protein